MTEYLIQAAYLAASVLFILGLKSLTRPDSARRGMQQAAVGMLLAIVGTLVCLALTSLVVGGLRVSDDHEFAGLDLSQHSENAYVFATGGYGGGTSFSSPGSPHEHRAALGANAMK